MQCCPAVLHHLPHCMPAVAPGTHHAGTGACGWRACIAPLRPPSPVASPCRARRGQSIQDQTPTTTAPDFFFFFFWSWTARLQNAARGLHAHAHTLNTTPRTTCWGGAFLSSATHTHHHHAPHRAVAAVCRWLLVWPLSPAFANQRVRTWQPAIQPAGAHRRARLRRRRRYCITIANVPIGCSSLLLLLAFSRLACCAILAQRTISTFRYASWLSAGKAGHARRRRAA